MFPLLLVYKCMRLSHSPGVCLTSRKPASISKIQRDTLSWKAGWKLGAVPVTSCDTRFLNGSRLDSQGENWSWFGGTVLTDAMWGLCTSQKTSGQNTALFGDGIVPKPHILWPQVERIWRWLHLGLTMKTVWVVLGLPWLTHPYTILHPNMLVVVHICSFTPGYSDFPWLSIVDPVGSRDDF